jgi:cyclic nucleotide-binding protein
VRVESLVTSLSWIPSEAIQGMMRLPFDLGPAHHDDPPPDHIDDIPALVEQGQAGDELLLLLDGVLSVEVDGKAVAEVGPGAILDERAILEGGTRTATLRALTPVCVAVATPDQVSSDALAEVAGGHRREENA